MPDSVTETSSDDAHVNGNGESTTIKDAEEYSRLFEKWRPLIYATALHRMKDPGRAEELVQDVCEHGLHTFHQVRDVNAFLSWIRTVTSRMGINTLTRKLHVGAPLEATPEGQAISNGPAPDARMEKGETKKSIREALEFLKPLDRGTLIAFYLKQKSLKEMASLFNVPIGTIKRRLHVARKRLKKVIINVEQFESLVLDE